MEPVDSYTVYQSPEFQAFCRRFDIPWDKMTVSITVELPADGLMLVTHRYRCEDTLCSGQEDPGDITAMHNDTWRANKPML